MPIPVLICNDKKECAYQAHPDDNLGHLVPGTKNVYIGADHTAHNSAWLYEHNIKHVFTMGAPISFPQQRPGIVYKEFDVRKVSHKHVMNHVVDAHEYIVNKLPENEGLLLVDGGGVSDAPFFALGHMMLSDWNMTPDEAVEALVASRDSVKVNPRWMVEAENLATTLYVYKLREKDRKASYLGTIKEDL